MRPLVARLRRRRIAAPLLLLSLLLLTGCSREGEDAGAAPTIGTEVGQRAPELEGASTEGEPFSLAGEAGSRRVLVFYQGAYCGLCRDRLRRLQEHLPAYRELGARVVAVTPDDPARSAELVRSLGLEFPVVSADPAALERWGLAEPGSSTTRPGTFVVDGDGEILFRHVGRNAGDRAGDAGLLTLLERHGRE